MSLFINRHTRVIVQGITGREGRFHTAQMIAAGTNIVGGITPGKGGEWLEGVPVFESVREAQYTTGAQASVIFVPARAATDAMIEAVDAGLELIVCITENVPVRDMQRVRRYLVGRNSRIVGPSSPGVLVPGEAKLGIIPTEIAMPGNVGVVSRSSTLLYEVVNALTARGIGQSICIGLGSDAVMGTTFVDALALLEEDAATDKIVLLGEIGGRAEEAAAAYIREHLTKPVTAYIAGRTAPENKRIGHSGAVIENGVGGYTDKIKALEGANIRLAHHLEQIAELV
jgi:succinyl-CoA synthetase alpha subunit